jgi:hypothetical protein
MSAHHAIRTRPRGRLIVGVLLATLGGTVSGPAAIAVGSVHLAAASGPLTVAGSASGKETLNVIFDPLRCATTLKEESARAGTRWWNGPVDGQFKHSFAPGAYPTGARWVCVYVQSLPPSPVTLTRSSTPLG